MKNKQTPFTFAIDLGWVCCENFEKEGWVKLSKIPKKFLELLGGMSGEYYFTFIGDECGQTVTNLEKLNTKQIEKLGVFLEPLGIPLKAIYWLGSGLLDSKAVSAYKRESLLTKGEYDLVIRSDVAASNPKELNRKLKCGIKELEDIGIPLSKDIEPVLFIDRSKRRFGSCQKLGTYCKISVTDRLLEADGLRETVYHELLHTCPNSRGHDARWKSNAGIVNRHFKMNITRLSSLEEKGLSVEDQDYKYKIFCKKCGNTYYRHKRSKLVDQPHLFKCKCGGDLCTELNIRGQSTVENFTTPSNVDTAAEMVTELDVKCLNIDMKDVMEKFTQQNEFKYRVICRNCGEVYYRNRRSAVTDNPERYRCNKCNQQTLELDKTYGVLKPVDMKQDIDESQYKYKIVCADCGKIYYKNKRSNITDNPQLYKCGRCSGKLSTIKL